MSDARKIAFLFPGQGAQSVGMGRSFFDASENVRRIYETFNQLVAPDLSQVCFEGPEEQLKRTLYTQPAILATSLAALELFREKSDLQPVVAAGHSLGEYGALYAVGAIDLESAAQLVQKRSELMENAPKGAMSAVLGLSEEVVKSVVAEFDEDGRSRVTVANYNTDGQQVISGEPDCVASAGEQLKEKGAKRVLPLAVGGAFHSSLMDDAAREFGAFLSDFNFSRGRCPVVTNVDAKPTEDAGELKAKLADQINHSVFWSQTMAVLFNEQGVDTVIEFGPGKVLTGMIRKAYRDVATYNVYDMETLESTVAELNSAQVAI